jgi:hypothetical protein
MMAQSETIKAIVECNDLVSKITFAMDLDSSVLNLKEAIARVSTILTSVLSISDYSTEHPNQ